MRSPEVVLLPMLRDGVRAVRIGRSAVVLFSSAAARLVLSGDDDDLQVDGLTGPDPRTDPAVRAEWLGAKRWVRSNLARTDDDTIDAAVVGGLEDFAASTVSASGLVERCQRLSASIITRILLPGASEELLRATAYASTTLIDNLQRPSRRRAARVAASGAALRAAVQRHAAAHDLPYDMARAFGRDRAERTLTTVLAGSHAIPGTSLAWLVHALSRHPHHEDAVGTAREVLRLYPPAWLLVRRARRDTSIDGWSINAGDDVHVSPYLVHHDPLNWERPDAFDPPRWSQPRLPRQHYLPFGAGRRMCPALTLSERIMAAVARNLDPAELRDQRVAPHFGTLLTPVPARRRDRGPGLAG